MSGAAASAVPQSRRQRGRQVVAHESDATVPVIDVALDTLLPCNPRATAARTLRFASSEHDVIINVTRAGQTVGLSIDVTPVGVVSIDVRPLHGHVRRLRADVAGHSHCADVPFGPVSLLVHWPMSAGGPVRTVWTLL